MPERRQTALGVARARFVEGLPRKAREVRASLALLAGTPDEERPREELRRRLHALYASAQVFRIGPLANALKDALAQIDAARGQRRGFSQDELDAFANLAATLPALGKEADPLTPSVAGLKIPDEIIELRDAQAAERESHAPRSSPRAHASFEAVVSVLVVDAPEWQARIRAALPPERFELMTATDPDEALRLARSGAPDVVLADRATVIAPGVDLVGRLREDPLTDFVPVVLLLPPGSPLDPIAVREAGADEALVKPFDAETLLKTVSRVTEDLAGPAGASTLTGDLTVEEIADRLADEVKRGLVEAAAKGRDVSIPLGDGTPLMAAAWSTIGRVRAHIAERSGGRVRFREGPQRGGPAFVSVVGDESAGDADVSVDLAGRRALVVDDDPAVVWFFAGLLREHGADAAEASDGIEALEEARRRRPDLIISDILMPRLDGFGLTRALKRDPILADVPVILLSWKEDFLQRMRQLQAGASGYLRKEAGSAQILASVREVLKPRARLESQLRTGGDVRGRLEDVGIQTLLSTVAAERPDARVTVRDAASLYEIDLRGSELIDVTRTASDGAFARGNRVLHALLGATTGRYTVADGEGPVRRSIEAPMKDAIRAGMIELAARVDAVSGKNLAKAEEVELDLDVASAVVRASPDEVERVVRALREGKSPRALLTDGDMDPRDLEEVLVDLARQGAIRRVIGPDREDRIALARDARHAGYHPELSEHEEQGTLSWLPTEETTQQILLETQQMAANAADRSAVDVDEAELQSLRPPAVPRELRGKRPLEELEPPPDDEDDRAKRSSDIPTLDEPFAGEPGSEPPLPADSEEITLEMDAPQDDAPTIEMVVGGDEVDEVEGGDDEDDDEGFDEERGEDDDEGFDEERDADDDEGFDEERDADDDEGFDEEEDESFDDDADDTVPDEDESDVDTPSLKVPPSVAWRDDDDEEPLRPGMISRGDSGGAGEDPGDEDLGNDDEDARPDESDLDAPDESRPAAAASERPVRPVSPPPSAERGMGWLGWAVTLLVLGAIGFVGWRLVDPASTPDGPGPVPPGETVTPTGSAAPPAPGPSTRSTERDEDLDSPSQAGGGAAGPEVPAAYGREEEGITALPGVNVGDGEGLLVLEPAPGGAAMTARIGERELRVAAERVGVALPEGVHHVTVLRGDNQDYIWVLVRAGHTRFVPPLP